MSIFQSDSVGKWATSERTALRRRAAQVALAVGAFAALAGCASMGAQTPEQQVEARAATYWQARVKADHKTAYSLLAPAYRGLNSEQDFVKQHGAAVNLRETGVAKVACESAERCTARISMTAKPMVPGLNLPLVTAYMDDTWVLEQGQWWRFQAP